MVVVEDADDHQPRPRSHARDADAVVGAGGDDAGDARPVTVRVRRVAVAIDEVGAVDVVDDAVTVVVAAVACDLPRVRPQVRREVGVAEVGAGVEDRDRHALAGRLTPGVVGAEVVQGPLAREQRVAGRRAGGRGPGRGGAEEQEEGGPAHAASIGAFAAGMNLRLRSGRSSEPGMAPRWQDDHAVSVGLKVYLCDDVPEFRALMRGVLATETDMEIVGEAGDGKAGVRGVAALHPDVVLDLSMPELDGLQALPLMRESVPDVRVVVLSGVSAPSVRDQALAQGADAYVQKGAPFAVIVAAVRG